MNRYNIYFLLAFIFLSWLKTFYLKAPFFSSQGLMRTPALLGCVLLPRNSLLSIESKSSTWSCCFGTFEVTGWKHKAVVEDWPILSCLVGRLSMLSLQTTTAKARSPTLRFRSHGHCYRIRALAPVGNGLLPRFLSRCCHSGTKGWPLVPVRETGAKALPLTPVGRVLPGLPRCRTITNRC